MKKFLIFMRYRHNYENVFHYYDKCIYNIYSVVVETGFHALSHRRHVTETDEYKSALCNFVSDPCLLLLILSVVATLVNLSL